MQEDIQNKSVALTTRTAKLTGHSLAKLMLFALRQTGKSKKAPKQGRQTVRQLAKGGSLQNIEINDGNIKAFEPFARKYGVSYALQKDASESPPRWLVFFRAKDADALTAAFKAFSAKMVKRETGKPSVKDAMQKFRENVRDAARGKTRQRDPRERERERRREGPEL